MILRTACVCLYIIFHLKLYVYFEIFRIVDEPGQDHFLEKLRLKSHRIIQVLLK